MKRPDDWTEAVALGGVIVATAVLSYSTLMDRAVHIGFDTAPWLYPVGVDALILGASRKMRDQSVSRRTRRAATVVTLGAIGAALAGFVAEFAPRGPAAVAFASLIPLSLAAALILTSWSATDRRQQVAAQEAAEAEERRQDAERAQRAAERASRANAPAVNVQDVPAVSDRAALASTAATSRTSPDVAARVQQAHAHQVQTGQRLTRPAMQAEFGWTDRQARLVQQKLRDTNGHLVGV